ncbi:LysR family transcriptional regulator [Dongia mobilis]|uniref:LysR family transcriptional regulator n=1 Tax=Dongia mobilis TaxID=578943 RepID=A0A4R6WIY2_9PROT|nr:LysR substrate-binding domain-containing protein [Dongia mobilis]TDQ78460.1 LysR family transcriptional regulator [Dongia mobilis]
MSYHLPPLPWLRSFEASARRGSFSAAAGELGLTSAAVSYQVRALEQLLGRPLFERLPRGLRLTDMGKAYLPSIRKAFSELSVSTLGIFGPEGDIAIDVRVSVSFGVLWLAPRLGDFLANHRNFRIRLFSAIWGDALPADNTDVDIRFGHGAWSGFSARLLINDPVVLVTPPGAVINGPGDIRPGQLIHILGVEGDWQHLFTTADRAPPFDQVGITVDTSLAALEMVAAGAGVALVLERFARPFVAQGRIRQVPDLLLPQDQSHYLLLRDGIDAPRAETMLFCDWLQQALIAERSPPHPETAPRRRTRHAQQDRQHAR